MTFSYRIVERRDSKEVEYDGYRMKEEELRAGIELARKELRSFGTPKKDKLQARQQITRYEEMLEAITK
jgi:hypothetical protein